VILGKGQAAQGRAGLTPPQPAQPHRSPLLHSSGVFVCQKIHFSTVLFFFTSYPIDKGRYAFYEKALLNHFIKITFNSFTSLFKRIVSLDRGKKVFYSMKKANNLYSPDHEF